MKVERRIAVRNLEEFPPISGDKAGCASFRFIGHYLSHSAAKREGIRHE
jgi:hypothetical protein